MVSRILVFVAFLLFLLATILEVMKDPANFPIFHDPLTAAFLGLAVFALSFLPIDGWVRRE